MVRSAPGLAAVVLAMALAAAPAGAAPCPAKRTGKSACAKPKPRPTSGRTYDGGPGDRILRPLSARDERRRVGPF